MKRGTKVRDRRTDAHSVRSALQAINSLTADPDELRDRVRNALTRISATDRAAVRDQLLNELQQSGLNIGNCLFSLGIMANMPGELTPSDLGYLVRYIRINYPEKMRVVAGLLNTLLSPNDEKTGSSQMAA
jgi:hypothetical protein